MIEYGRGPTAGRVTVVAIRSSAKVAVWLAGRDSVRCIIVTGIAGYTADSLVIEGAADKSRGGMTIAAIAGGRQMWSVGFVVLPGYGGIAIDVAGIAAGGRRDVAMVESSADKGGGIMTNSAILNGVDMVGRFTRGVRTIVAGLTLIHDLVFGMIKGPGYESGGCMALYAVQVGGYMEVVFADGGCAIVA